MIQYVDEVANGWLYFVGPITNSFRENRLMEYLGLGIPNGQTFRYGRGRVVFLGRLVVV